MKEISLDNWEKVMTGRCFAMLATEMCLLENTLPRSRSSAIVELLCNEDNRVRGNRPKDSIPNWDDARYCLASTLRMCLAMLEHQFSHKEPQDD